MHTALLAPLAFGRTATGKRRDRHFQSINSDIEAMLLSADRHGLISPNHQWLFPDTTTEYTPLSTGNVTFVAQALHGALQLMSSPRESEGFKRLQRLLPQISPGECSDVGFNATGEEIGLSSLSSIAAYAYDAAAAAVRESNRRPSATAWCRWKGWAVRSCQCTRGS